MSIGIFLLFLMLPSVTESKELSLKDCLTSFEQTSPTLKKVDFYKEIHNNEKKNLYSEYLPKLNLAGQAQYQSDVFKLPISNPLFTIPSISKDQYQLTADLNQLLFDGFAISNSKEISDTKLTINENSLQVDALKFKQSILQAYFGIIFLQKQKEIVKTILKDLNDKENQIKSMVESGVVLQSAYNQLNVEILKKQQDTMQINSDILNLKSTLKILAGLDNTDFEIAVPKDVMFVENQYQKRPEFSLFKSSEELFDKNKKLVNSNYYPKVSAFVHAGYGSPNPLNMFDQNFSSFYIIGLRFQWEIFDWGRNSRSKEVFTQNRQMIESDRENFENSLKISLNDDMNNISKNVANVELNEQILQLQNQITMESYSQMINGTITMSEYLQNVDNFERTKIQKEISEIQVLQYKYDYLLKSNQDF